MRTCSVLLGLVLLPGVISPAAPCELPVCTVPGAQIYTRVVTDGAGGALVVWTDFRDGQDEDLYAQRVQRLPTGLAIAPGWPANGRALTTAARSQVNTRVVSDGAGGAIVVWEDNRDVFISGADIYAQRVTAEGTIAPGWPADGLPLCTAPGYQSYPSVAQDGAGGAIVVWEDYRVSGGSPGTNSDSDIYSMRVRPDGSFAPGWAVNGNPVCTAPEQQATAVVVADAAGGAIVAWGDLRDVTTNRSDVYAQRLTPAGETAAGWPAQGMRLSSAPERQGANLRIVTDGAGGAIVAWVDFRNEPGSREDIFAQRVTATGAIAAGWPPDGLAVCVAPGLQLDFGMVADEAGGALLVWEDYRNYASTAADLYGQRITGSGEVALGWVANGVLVATGPGWQLTPSVVGDGQGGMLLGFTSYPDAGGGYDLFAQRVTADGSIPPGWPAEGRALCTEPSESDYEAAAVADGAGGMIVASEHVTTVTDIYAQWIPGDGIVPTLVSLVGAEVDAERVVLTWYGPEGGGTGAAVERRSETSDWMRLASVTADGTGTFRYEDRAVTPGTRYAYRLRYRTGAEELVTGEHWVQVPLSAFALHGPQPNPATADLMVGFSLPSTEPATLALYDVSGRRVLDWEVGSLGAGVHRLNLSRGLRLAPGIYSLRLTQGARRETAGAVVLR